jgi:hypothetical protein
MPSTTGSTNSRWLGFGDRLTAALAPAGDSWMPAAPRWYFTSPEPCVESGSTLPSNSLKIWASGLPMVLARTFSRPRWAMPMTASWTPWAAASFNTRSSRGMSASHPSSEKRLWPM